MKTPWLVIDQSKKALARPYVCQYLLFETFNAMVSYIEKAGFVGEPAAFMCDPGMVNFFREGDIDLKIMKLEIK